jgi:hypothetical protein
LFEFSSFDFPRKNLFTAKWKQPIWRWQKKALLLLLLISGINSRSQQQRGQAAAKSAD